MNDQVTILIYTFPEKGSEAEPFKKIVASIEQTWKCCGRLKTVIVASHRFAEVENFVAGHSNVELQIEPSLVYGNIKTMSLDCIKRLYTRFSTPYVLIIQDDGYPLKSNLDDFVGKADFWGAPIISDGWKRKLAYAIGLGSFNGGFSLRSRRLCEYASKMWHSFFSKFMKEDNRHLGEDFYYTTLLKFLPSTWWKFKFPNEKEAFRFSVDRLGGKVTPPPDTDPFGVHGKMPEVTVLAYHFLENEGYEAAFEKVRHAFEETWRHCGRLKSVLVVNETAPCVERFAAENDNVEVQVEPSLVPGKIFTMSADMNGRLYSRFGTPYVLIIQNDGYPLRPGLEQFVGKWDFIGAPSVRDGRRRLMNLLGFPCLNGGFSLRSRRICIRAANAWNRWWRFFLNPKSRFFFEDTFYTLTACLGWGYRHGLKFAGEKDAFAFAFDSLKGLIAKSKDIDSFGIHGRSTVDMLRRGIENTTVG